MKGSIKTIVFSFGLLALARSTPAHSFNLLTIDPPGSTFTFPFGINPQGDIVGNYVLGNVIHGFLLRGSRFTNIDFPGATNTFARRINPQGDIVGFYAIGDVTRGFLLRDGKFSAIEFPGATITLAFGINPQRDIVGWYIDSGGRNHGFLLRKGSIHEHRFSGRDLDQGFRH